MSYSFLTNFIYFHFKKADRCTYLKKSWSADLPSCFYYISLFQDLDDQEQHKLFSNKFELSHTSTTTQKYVIKEYLIILFYTVAV